MRLIAATVAIAILAAPALAAPKGAKLCTKQLSKCAFLSEAHILARGSAIAFGTIKRPFNTPQWMSLQLSSNKIKCKGKALYGGKFINISHSGLGSSFKGIRPVNNGRYTVLQLVCKKK